MWRNIIGKAFSPAAFDQYLAGVKLGTWRPKFITVHNTSAPDLKTWNGWQARKPPISDEQWLQNLVGYYRDQQHWSGGPHLFVTPAHICVFTPLDGPGVHTPSWNDRSWGVETVGEFETDLFDGSVRDNLIAALASLHKFGGLTPLPYQLGVRGLHFHKEDAATTHRDCPGKHMVKADLVAAVSAKMGLSIGGPAGGSMAAAAPAPAVSIPPWLAQMRALTGTLESPGAADNPVILKWPREIAAKYPDLGPDVLWYNHDSIPWCGLAAAICMTRAGEKPPAGMLGAGNWANFGQAMKLEKRTPGSIFVYNRVGGHHVTMYESEDSLYYYCRGGNQSDAINVTRIPRSRPVLAVRWGLHTPIPTTGPKMGATPNAVSSSEA